MNGTERLAETRRFTDELLSWVRGKGKIVIIVHDNPDPDCLASAMALRRLFVMKVNKDSVISFSGMIGRSENLAMAKELEIPLTPLSLIDMNDYQVVCMLDTQPDTGNNSLPRGVRPDLVIDHHPLRESSKGCRWVDVREGYGATSTILYEYLLSQDVSIGVNIATALFYAIKSETQDLGREASQTDRDAYLRLFPVSNKRLLYEITHPKLPVEYFSTVSVALEHAKIYDSVLVANLWEVSFPEIVAEMADFLLRLEGIDMVLCVGRYNDDLIISMRTTRHDVNAGDVMRRLVTGKGVAGGHGMMAGGKLDNVPADPSRIQDAERLLTGKLLEELAAEVVEPRTLIRQRR